MRDLRPAFDAEEQELASALSTRKTACPPLDVLLAVGQDVLPDEVEKAASGHIMGCKLCSGLIADFATLPGAEMTASEQQRVAATLPRAEQKSRSMRWITGIAAGLVLCVGGFVALRGHVTEQTQVAGRLPVTAEPAQSSVAELSIPLTPLAPPQDAAIITRGGHAGVEPSTAELLPAFTAYNHADYAGAAREFGRLATAYPASGTVRLYLGVSELYQGRDREAQDSLRVAGTAVRSDGSKNAALWYGAIAANRLHSAEARVLLRRLCDGHDAVYSSRSCGLL